MDKHGSTFLIQLLSLNILLRVASPYAYQEETPGVRLG